MVNWFRRLLPREDGFFDMFERHSRTLVAGADALVLLMKGGEGVPEHCAAIARHEHEADLIAGEVMVAIRRTFITPFDRSDIKDLIQSMDDAIDQMHKTAKTITLFGLRDFDPPMRDLAALAVEAARLTERAMPLMRAVGENAAAINAFAEQVVHLEEKADALHDIGLRDLHDRFGRTDPMAFILGSQLYEHLEKVVDRFEDVAGEMNAIVIEHV